MNKTPEQIAEEMYPFSDFGGIRLLQTSMNENRDRLRKGFVDGYHSRDSEIEKLVEVLKKLIDNYKSRVHRYDTLDRLAIEEAEEAIKPYTESEKQKP